MGKLNRLFSPALSGLLSLSLAACASSDSPQDTDTGATGKTQGSTTDSGAGNTKDTNSSGDATGPADPKTPGLEERKSTLPRATPEVSDEDKAVLRDGNRDLSFDLLRNTGKDASENAAVSAISMRAAFGMVHAMARGETQSEIATALKLLSDPAKTQAGINDIDQTIMSRNLEKSQEEAQVLMSTGNRMFVRKGMVPGSAFLDTLAQNYGAGIYETDFAGDPEGSRKAINNWVSNKTYERIPELFPPSSITPNIVWVLTNAMYFKAPWAMEMKASEPIEFTLADGSNVSADGITNSGFGSSYGTQTDFEWAMLPLRGGSLGAIVVLPNEGKYAQVENTMSANVVNKMIAEQKTGEIEVSLPKFKIETGTMDYTRYMSQLMPKAFRGADFGGFGDASPTPISFVYHSVFLAADEKGVEAAAATGVGSKESAPEIVYTLNVNRPFMFLVYDKPSGLILFAGRVMNPAA